MAFRLLRMGWPSRLRARHQDTSVPEPATDSVGVREADQEPRTWWLDRGLAEQLRPLASRARLAGEALDIELQVLAEAHGDVVLAELVFLFANLKLDPREARDHWLRVRAHERALFTHLPEASDVRVALVSYFLNVQRRFERPMIVEAEWVERVATSAYVDETTGLPNQRFLREQLVREVGCALDENSPLSVIFIDADNFKDVNDNHGHRAGDEVLRAMAGLIRAGLPKRASLVRYGGEEFVAVVPAAPKQEAAAIAERVRAAVAGASILVTKDAHPLTVTVSLGVATCPADAQTREGLLEAADGALYRAKRAGRNRVALFGESTRSFGRQRVAWAGQIRPLGLPVQVQGLELGGGGLAFQSDRRYEIESLMEVTVVVPGQGAVALAGRVVWTKELEPGVWKTALRIVEQGVAARQRLARWAGERPEPS